MAIEIITIEDLQNMKGESIEEFKKLLKEQFGHYLDTHERLPTIYLDLAKKELMARIISIRKQFNYHPVLNPVADKRDNK